MSGGQRFRKARGLAAALATLFAVSASAGEEVQQAVHEVRRYCAASWRAAGIPPHEWEDCTQEVFARLLRKLRSLERTDEAVRELKRAIWSTAKGFQRRPRPIPLENAIQAPGSDVSALETNDWLHRALQAVTPRQREILRLWLHGASVREIAQDLGMRPERVSDEKYKALRKLRDWLQRDGEPDRASMPPANR